MSTHDEAPLSRYLSILPHTPEEKVLRLLVQLGIRITNADEGSLLVLDEASNDLVFAMTEGNEQGETTLKGQRVPLGKGVTGLAAVSREVQIDAPTFLNIEEPKNVSGNPRWVMAAPMLVGDQVVGVITAVTFKPDVRFGGKEADIYAGFASVAGVIVEQRRRLAKYEVQDAGAGEPAELTERERSERAIFQSLQRILQTRPEFISQVATLLTAVEGLSGHKVQ